MDKAQSQNKDTDAPSPTEQSNSQCNTAKSKGRPKQKVKVKEATSTAKGWQVLGSGIKSKWRSNLACFARENFFQLLGTISLIVCGILFTFQAYLAFRSFQMMNQIQRSHTMSEMIYRIYFEGHDWAMEIDKVDLRANTSIFIH